MWTAIAYVSTGFALAAFITAAIAWVYKNRAQKQERLIQLAPEDTRSALVENALEFSNIDTTKLTRAQLYELAIKQLQERGARFRITAIIVVLIAMLAAGIGVFAISKQTTESTAKSPYTSPTSTPSVATPTNTPSSNTATNNNTQTNSSDNKLPLSPNNSVSMNQNIQNSNSKNGAPVVQLASPSVTQATPSLIKKTELVIQECLENDPCPENAKVIDCFPSDEHLKEVGGTPHWLFKTDEVKSGNYVARPILFGAWSNAECAVNGTGWHTRIGSCEQGGRGTNLQRCVRVKVQYEKITYVKQ